MNEIKFIIRRFATSEHHQIPNKIVGFDVVNEETNNSIYHETILMSDEVLDKSSQQCIDLAFNKLSSSMSVSVKKLIEDNENILGSYYIPS